MSPLFDPFGADEAERSRATMMDVPRFAEYHKYELIVVENVVEVTRWPGFTPWLTYMRNLGYDVQALCINSLIAHPTPQSRDRIYFVFWKRGNRKPDLAITPRSYCPSCEANVDARQAWRRPTACYGKFRRQYDYLCPRCANVVYPYAYAAASAIDWSLPTQRIGDRRKPLAPATRRRVEVGLERFGGRALVEHAVHADEQAASGSARARADDAAPSQTTTLSHALAVASWLVPMAWGTDIDRPPRTAVQPFATQTGRLETGLAVPPFLALLRSGRPRTIGVDEPMATVVSDGSGHALVEPFIAE
ncbi:MAG: DNA cytosine methyltransferase, partial [Candidatus Dormibacteria bacterium]